MEPPEEVSPLPTMAAEQPGPPVADEADWRCAICLELLYKPCVNTCGHVACFWCFHQSMNPFQPSQCPLCRARFAHLPRVCPQLHALLGAAFPLDYAQRASETAESEAERGAESEAVPVEPRLAQSAAATVEARRRGAAAAAAAAAAAGVLAAVDAVPAGSAAGAEGCGPVPVVFECNACHQLLLEPCVLTCGHAVCRGCAARARGSHERQQGQGQRARGCCPACGEAQQSQPPGVCMQFDKLLRAWLPEATAAREAEAALSAPEEPAEAGAEGAAAAQAPLQPRQEGPQGAAAAAPGGAPQLPATAAALLASNRPLHEIWPDLERELLAVADERYCWHGVGCDRCGLYPIEGRRYRCTDCPEAIGFDLCGACYDRGDGDGDGRFNQRHTRQHRMEKVVPEAGWADIHEPRNLTPLVNFLQMVHPELTAERVLELLWMQLGAPERAAAEAEAGAGAEGDEGPAPEEEAGAGGEGPQPEPRGRGQAGDAGGGAAGQGGPAAGAPGPGGPEDLAGCRMSPRDRSLPCPGRARGSRYTRQGYKSDRDTLERIPSELRIDDAGGGAGFAAVRALLASTTLGQYLAAKPPSTVLTLTTAQTAGQALRALAAASVLSAPLFDAGSGDFVGFLDLNDILRAFLGLINVRELTDENRAFRLRTAGLQLEHTPLSKVVTGLDGALVFKAAVSSSLLDVIRFGFLLEGSAAGSYGDGPQVVHRVGVFDVDLSTTTTTTDDDEEDEEARAAALAAALAAAPATGAAAADAGAGGAGEAMEEDGVPADEPAGGESSGGSGGAESHHRPRGSGARMPPPHAPHAPPPPPPPASRPRHEGMQGIRILHVVSQSDVIDFLARRADELGGLAALSLAQLGLAAKPVVCVPGEMTAINAFATLAANRVSSVGVVSHDGGAGAGTLSAGLSSADLRGLLPHQFASLALPVMAFLGAKASSGWPHGAARAPGASAPAGAGGAAAAAGGGGGGAAAGGAANEWGLKGSEALAPVHLVSCGPDAPLAAALALLSSARAHRLYVTDDHRRPAAVVTLTDLLRALIGWRPPRRAAAEEEADAGPCYSIGAPEPPAGEAPAGAGGEEDAEGLLPPQLGLGPGPAGGSGGGYCPATAPRGARRRRRSEEGEEEEGGDDDDGDAAGSSGEGDGGSGGGLLLEVPSAVCLPLLGGGEAGGKEEVEEEEEECMEEDEGEEGEEEEEGEDDVALGGEEGASRRGGGERARLREKLGRARPRGSGARVTPPAALCY
ncbi:hypothetical protein Rsub_02418 [Raphidocelis subcapitata]|uniref:Uncharacterized protein n=1 Tax=Raphidocelis subcapitata TaxID=307507 RepID=A0A2V0NUG1_9CHLO|nr:hypothetical protein Rsub_02418 [Raphidocelis subcapitata]|eukprot:GBF90312.1 hypothetical protein Rsub_02418 [Raphidocelis subcapitata]